MDDYAPSTTCRMQILRRYLDDAAGGPCGLCDICTASSFAVDLPPASVQEAVRFLRSTGVVIEPRKQLPNRRAIPPERRCSPGAPCRCGATAVGAVSCARAAETGRFDDKLVAASVELIRQRWRPDPFPTWVTFVPSWRSPALVADFARRLAWSLGLACEDERW